MGYVRGEDREQLALMPMCLDDYIGTDNICRVIAAYVGSLDMAALGFKYAEQKDTGRPPYAPASMLMLYLYGYLNRIRSSRRLEAETKRNVEIMWLLEKVTPDDKTICNFRKDNAAALSKVFREFSIWCNRQGLYGKELVAVDGSKVRANSSRKNIHTKTLTAKELWDVEKKISEYMKALEEKDAEEEATPSPEAIRKTLERLNEKKVKLREWQEQIEANGGKEISSVDPDARIMKQGGDGRNFDACYNVQTVVDDKNKLIVDFDVTTCPNENGTLPKITESAKEIMGVDEVSVVADRGYYNGADIEECEQNGTKCYIPAKGDLRPAPDPRYNKKHFKYNAEKDYYICPEGHEFSRKFEYNRRGQSIDGVYYNTKACQECPHREQCTTDKKHGRKILRIQYQNTLDIIDSRMKSEAGRERFSERKSIVEHPFGTTKQIWGYKQYLCRGLEKVTAEQSLTFLAYNFRRVCKIFEGNFKDLIGVLG
jgi:transposase